MGSLIDRLKKETEQEIQTERTSERRKTAIRQTYGSEKPTFEQIEEQAGLYNFQSGEKETSIFLVNAVGNGVISRDQARSIYKKLAGKDLFAGENISSAIDYGNGVIERRFNNNIPVWREEQSAEKYDGISEEDAKAELDRLYGIDPKKKTPQERSNFDYLLSISPSETVKRYVKDSTDKKEEARFKVNYEAGNTSDSSKDTGYALSMYHMYPDAMTPVKDAKGNIIRFEIDEEKLKSHNVSQAEIDVLLSANANYNSDKVTTEEEKNKKIKQLVSEYTMYAREEATRSDIYYSNAYKETVVPYEEKAKQQPGFETYGKYDEKIEDKEYKKVNIESPVPALGEGSILPVIEELYFLTTEERKVYNSLYKRNKNEAKGYLEVLRPHLYKRMTAYNLKQVEKTEKESPFLANVQSVVLRMAGYIPGAYHTLKGGFTNTYDENHPFLQATAQADYIRSITSESIKNPVLRAAYNIGMSMIDSGVMLPLGKFGIIFLGTGAGVSEARRVASEGGDDFQILTRGISAGIFEAIFEKLGLDNLFKPKAVGSLRNLIKTALEQGSIEATEEMLTSISNIIVDSFVSGGEGQFNQLVMGYMEQGLTMAEAKRKAALDMVGEVGMETLAGLVSGLFFGAGGGAINYTNATSTGKSVNAKGNTDALIDFALMQNKESTAYKDASKMQESGETGNAKVGALLQQMIIDKQITASQAETLVSTGLNGAPLNEEAQVYFYAGASGVSFMDAAKLGDDLSIDGETAYAAWKKGTEIRAENDKARFKPETSLANPTLAKKVQSGESSSSTQNDKAKAKGIFDSKVGTKENFATQEDVESYIDYAYEYAEEARVKGKENVAKQKEGIIYGQADSKLVNDLKRHFGVDVTGAYHVLNDNDIRHTKNSHGEETNEKYPITAADQKQIPDIVKNYDDVLYVKTPGGKEGIYYVKRHNGVTYYLEAIKSNNTLSNKQMIKTSTGTIPDIPGLRDAINKKWNINSALDDSDVPRMYVQDVKNNVPANNISQKSSSVKKAYIEAARAYRTEENAKEFDEAYNIGLAGETLDGFAPDADITSMTKAYMAGVHDKAAFREREAQRTTFNATRKGLSSDNLTETLIKRYSAKTREVLQNLGEALGVQIKLVTNSGIAGHEMDSYYDSKSGVIAINVNEVHRNPKIKTKTKTKDGSLSGDDLIRFVAAHEGIHRIRETSPKAYAQMEKIALSKSKVTVSEYMKEHGVSEAIAKEEITADYFGDLLTNKAEIKALMNKNRGLFDIIWEVLEKIGRVFSEAGIDFAEIAEARRLFREALKEADSSVWGEDVRSGGEVMWSLSQNAKRDVKAALDDVSIGGDIKLTDATPSIMLGHKGVKNLPLWMKASHIRENIFTEAEAKAKRLKVNKYINYHGLGDTLFFKIIDSLDDVTLAYRGTKNAKDPARRENCFLLITQIKDSTGNTIIVPIYINETRNINKNFVTVNLLATAYGKRSMEDYIRKEVKDGNLVRIKRKSTQSSESTSPINADYRMGTSNDNIPQESGVVNTYSMQDSKKNTDKLLSRSETREGEILSLKHNKNVYSLFKGAKRILPNKDYISDGYVAIPFSEEAFEKVKKAAKKAYIETGSTIPFEKIFNDNDVVIQGDPKIWEEKLPAYIFKINGTYYTAQQKYIDTFNNGKNIIKANSEKYSLPWTVQDENGNFIAAFMPMKSEGITDEEYDKLKKVSEVKQEQAEQNEKEEPYNDKDFHTLSKNEVKYFPKGEAPRRDIDVPSEIEGKKVMRGARTAAEAPGISDEIAEDIPTEIENGRFFYTPSVNALLMANAQSRVSADYDVEMAAWLKVVGGGRVRDVDIALGEALIIETSKRGDAKKTMDLICDLAILANEAGKAVQAMRLLKRMSPEGQLMYINKVAETITDKRSKEKGKKFEASENEKRKVRKFEEATRNAEADVKAKEKTVSDLEGKIEALTDLVEAENEVSAMDEEIKALKRELSILKSEIKKQNADKDKLSSEIDFLEKQIAEQSEMLLDAIKRRDSILSERGALSAELNAIKREAKNADEASDRINAEIEILEEDISDASKKRDAAKKFRDELTEERKKLGAERRTLIEKTKSADKASEKDLKRISELNNEIMDLSDKLEVASKNAEDAAEVRRKLVDERNRLKGKLERAENATSRENGKAEKYKKDILELLSGLKAADEALAEAKAKREVAKSMEERVKEAAKLVNRKAGVIEIPTDIADAILKAKSEEELNDAVELAKDYIAANIEPTWAEKIRAWRYMAMLGNARTQIRNLLGNALMLLPVMTKNGVASVIEPVAEYAVNSSVEKQIRKMEAKGATAEEIEAYRDFHRFTRSKSAALWKNTPELKAFAEESWKANEKMAMEGGKYDNIAGDINDRRQIFKPKLLEAYRKGTSNAMEAGDRVFLRLNYKWALTGYMIANKLTPDTITEAQKLQAEQYALKEAREATFRDKSRIAQEMNKIKGLNWGTELLIGGIFPFTQTPINVTKRAFEYSPLGIANVVSDIVNYKGGKVEITDVINSIAKMATGSAIVYIGFMLAAEGLLRSTGDDEDEEYDYLAGEQDYALKIGNYRYSIDWASPAAIPLLFGAAIYEGTYGADGGIKEHYKIVDGKKVLNTSYVSISSVLSAAGKMFAPIFEVSYLSGLADAIDASAGASGDSGAKITTFAAEAILSYGGQFVPTWMGQIARSIDISERRNNDYDRTLPIPYTVQKGAAKILNKIPGVNTNSTPYVDPWGEEQVKESAWDYAVSIFENLASPGYIEEVTDDELTKELWRIEKATGGEKKVFPTAVGYKHSETIDDVEKQYDFTPEQHNEWQRVTGKTGRKIIGAFVESDGYEDLTDDARAKAIDLLWDYAKAEGIAKVFPDYKSSNTTVQKMQAAGKNLEVTPEDYVYIKLAVDMVDKPNDNGDLGTYTQDEYEEALGLMSELTGEDLTGEQLAYIWQAETDGNTKNNKTYGKYLRGTPWWKNGKKDGKTWMKER